MCGLFGAIGKKINPGIIRALAIANRERGTDSLGFFSNDGKSVKRAEDPLRCLSDDDFADYIDRACAKGWFLAGHTRHATRGGCTDGNAHPFRYGRYIGSHNGIVWAPKKYRVDSMFLIDRLHKNEGDYQAAFADIEGYWGLTWFDGKEFYLQSHNNDIAIVRDGKGTWYYSSDFEHLDACARPTRDWLIIDKGATIRFNCKSAKYEVLKPFVSKVAVKSWAAEKKVKSGKTKAAAAPVKTEQTAASADPFHVEKDDRAWDDAWDDYSNQYESGFRDDTRLS